MLAVIDSSDLLEWWGLTLLASLALFYGGLWALNFLKLWREAKTHKEAGRNRVGSLAKRAVKRTNAMAMSVAQLKKALKCSLCWDPAKDGLSCVRCGAITHSSCAEEMVNNRCPVAGCGAGLR